MIILGFGSQEEIARDKIRNLVKDAIKNGQCLHTLSKEHNAVNKIYDAMSKEEAPERYTNFYVYDNEIHFNHINRRHALSPDGWALLQVVEDI